MSTRYRGVITAGRTLLTCSPEQFEQFLSPHDTPPQTGALRLMLAEFNYTCTVRQWVWHIEDSEKVPVCAETNERAALRKWWFKVGRELVVKHREEVADWKKLLKPGRPGASEDDPDAWDGSSRTQLRNDAMDQMGELWMELRTTLTGHAAISELWMDLANDRSVPKPNTLRKLGARRTLRHALHHLLDIDRMNPAIHDSIWHGTVPDEKLAAALSAEVPDAAARGDAAGICARLAMQVGLQLSPRSAEEYFQSVRRVLHSYELLEPSDLRELTRRAIN